MSMLGAVYDRGYRPYDGVRGGRGATRWALWRLTVRRALGLRRSWRQKVLPWSLQFLEQSRAAWTANGGEMVTLPEAESKELKEKLASVGDDIVKDKPDMKPMWDMLVAISKR